VTALDPLKIRRYIGPGETAIASFAEVSGGQLQDGLRRVILAGGESIPAQLRRGRRSGAPALFSRSHVS